MTAAADMAGSGRPRLAPHARLSFDRRRDRWVILAPERMLVPDETALEILRRCTGEATIDGIVDALAAEFDAPREEIAADVRALLEDLRDKGLLAW